MPPQTAILLAGIVFGIALGVIAGDSILAWRLRRATEHWSDWLAQAAEAAANYDRMILEDRIDQLAAGFEVVGHLIGIERE